MAVTVVCPHCGASRSVLRAQLGTEVTCTECGGGFLAAVTPPSGPIRGVGPRPAPCDESDEAEGGWSFATDPPKGDSRNGASRDRLAPLSMWLMVVAIIQTCGHIVAFVVLLSTILAEKGPGDRSMALFVVCVVFCFAVLKDVFVLRGVAALRERREHDRAKVGVFAAIIPDIFWLFALIPAVWCFVLLDDPNIRQTFAEYRPSDPDEF